MENRRYGDVYTAYTGPYSPYQRRSTHIYREALQMGLAFAALHGGHNENETDATSVTNEQQVQKEAVVTALGASVMHNEATSNTVNNMEMVA